MTRENVPSIAIAEMATMWKQGQQVDLIDVRTAVEFAEVHALGARNMPLDRLDPASFAGDGQRPVYLICKSGSRARQACQKLMDAGVRNAMCVEGGIDAWLAAGLPVERQEGVLSLERQVRIVAGLLVLIGVILGAWLSSWFYLLSAFVGAGLVFAGVTNFCGMALLLAKLPWNRYQPITCSR